MENLTKKEQEDLITLIQEVIDYLWIDEKRHYSENDKPKVHIYKTLKSIKKLVNKTKERKMSNVEILQSLSSWRYE
tara:strand:+ start:1365 stop:1592 length:228 start_codon:yes stop_codon:yes gene_type:complete